MIIGITGSFGSGKSTITSFFAEQGFHAINVDALYHGIYAKNKSLKKKLIEEFKMLDRNKIKEIVFSDAAKLKKLNEITHPFIFMELRKAIVKIKTKEKNPWIAVDIPLLFESKSERMFDHIVVVKTTRKKQFSNILKKNKDYTKKEISQIIKSQMPLAQKVKKADFVVDNSAPIKNVQLQIKKIVSNLVIWENIKTERFLRSQ